MVLCFLFCFLFCGDGYMFFMFYLGKKISYVNEDIRCDLETLSPKIKIHSFEIILKILSQQTYVSSSCVNLH